MTKIKTSELTGAALDWCVAQVLGTKPQYNWDELGVVFHGAWETEPGHGSPVSLRPYSTDWSIGGPIIARERISLDQFDGQPARAYKGTPVSYESVMFAPEGYVLTAAMRCYVASKMGDVVEVPEELFENA